MLISSCVSLFVVGAGFAFCVAPFVPALMVIALNKGWPECTATSGAASGCIGVFYCLGYACAYAHEWLHATFTLIFQCHWWRVTQPLYMYFNIFHILYNGPKVEDFIWHEHEQWTACKWARLHIHVGVQIYRLLDCCKLPRNNYDLLQNVKSRCLRYVLYNIKLEEQGFCYFKLIDNTQAVWVSPSRVV